MALEALQWATFLEVMILSSARLTRFTDINLVHFTTFLSLLIPNVTSDSPLNPGAFVAVWMLSGIVCAIVAARWKYAALGFAGLSG